jgi:hypothetical protein
MSYPNSLSANGAPTASLLAPPDAEADARRKRAERQGSLRGWQDQLRTTQENRERTADRIADLEQRAFSTAAGLTTTRTKLALDELGRIEQALIVERRIAGAYDAAEQLIRKRIAELEPLVAADAAESKRERAERLANNLRMYRLYGEEYRVQWLRDLNHYDRDALLEEIAKETQRSEDVL